MEQAERAVVEAAARSKGNPLFALQVLHAWAMGGHLELKGGRYSVPRASIEVRAATTAELWEERLRALQEELSAIKRADAAAKAHEAELARRVQAAADAEARRRLEEERLRLVAKAIAAVR